MFCVYTVIARITNPSNLKTHLHAIIYDAVDDKSHDYEVVAKVKTNKIEPPPTRTDGRDGFDLNQCPAYVVVPTPRSNLDGDFTENKDGLYETISSP